MLLSFKMHLLPRIIVSVGLESSADFTYGHVAIRFACKDLLLNRRVFHETRDPSFQNINELLLSLSVLLDLRVDLVHLLNITLFSLLDGIVSEVLYFLV